MRETSYYRICIVVEKIVYSMDILSTGKAITTYKINYLRVIIFSLINKNLNLARMSLICILRESD